MMRRAGTNDKLDEILDLLGLSMDEKFAAAAFYNNEADEEALKAITFLDLSAVSPASAKKVEELAGKLVQKKRMDELARLFLLVFARGGTTCYPMFSKDHLELIAQTQGMDRAKVVAVYSAKVVKEACQNIHSIQAIFDIVKKSTEMLRQAAAATGHDVEDGRLLLLAMYFRVEYQNRKPYALGRRNTDGSLLPVTEVEAEDVPLLAEYERLVIKGFAELYLGCVDQMVTKEAVAKLCEDFAEGRVAKELAPLIGTNPGVEDRLHKLVVGLAYWNYMLSDKLKNIVKLCLAVDCQKTLEALRVMSQGISMDIVKKGGNYDEVFGIDTEIYLRWAARWNFKEILKKQLKTHEECYLNLIETTEIDHSANLLAVMKEEDGALYQKVMQEKKQRMERGDNPEREKMIAELVKGVPNRDRALAYLRGEGKVDTIYRGNKLVGMAQASFGLLARWHFDNYIKSYGDEAFLRRGEAFALLNNGMDFFKVGLIGHKDSKEFVLPEKVEKIWADLEEEGVGLKWQFAGVLRTYQSLCRDNREDFFRVAVKIFAGYLKERRKELIAAFHGANAQEALGRRFALEVFGQDAGENKEEIFAYLQDTDKSVKQSLFEILCGEKGFEEDVKGLLFSKKAAERELAVRVLCFWQGAGADYREMFAQAFGKERSAKVKALLVDVLAAQEMGMDGAGADQAGAVKAGAWLSGIGESHT